jgi:hypothetical protein
VVHRFGLVIFGSIAETQVCHRSYIIAAKISPRVKTMHNGFFPPISLLNISVYRLQSRLLIDSPPYLKKKQKDHWPMAR